jgi:hypothetical protein
MGLFNRKPKKVMRVRLQHELLDNAAIEGILIGRYDTYLHLRAATTIIEGVQKPIPHDELLVPYDRVVFLEVLSRDVWAPGDGTT